MKTGYNRLLAKFARLEREWRLCEHRSGAQQNCRSQPGIVEFCKKSKGFTALVLLLGLSACSSTLDRLEKVGQPPEMSAIENPVLTPGYRPVSLPMPQPRPVVRNPNSLWQPGAKSFFKDLRATDVGDLVTVVIEIKDQAQLSNTSERTRANSQDLGIGNLLGLETQLQRVLPNSSDPDSLIGTSSDLSNKGTGKVNRKEDISLRVAATVTQKLPNGNLVILGRQEIRVNFEVRELQVAGIVRAEDISASNTIDYDKIAEARISYGGHGHITDVQQPRYGDQVLDVILPF
jgi:flagellar L-ring protein precursor FlgH